MTTGRDEAAWRGFEARLAAVESLIPDAPRWAGPAESPNDGTLSVVRGATVRRARSTERSSGSIGSFRLAAGFIAVAMAAVGLALVAGSREPGPGTARELPVWTHSRWVPVDGGNLTLDIADGRFVLGDDPAEPSVVELTTSPRPPDRLLLEQAAAGLGCAAGSSAEYEWRLDGARITFIEVTETCASRGAMLARTWVREFPRRTVSAIQAQPGEYRLGWLRPAVGLTLPDDISVTRVLDGPRLPADLDDYWDATAGSGVVAIARMDRIPVDACQATAGDRDFDAASLADALAGLRSVSGLEVGAARSISVDGYDAFEVDVGVTTDCADGEGRLWSAMPTTLSGEGGDGLVLPGGAARVRIVQVGDSYVAVAVNLRPDSPPGTRPDTIADELRPLIDSITFD